MKYDHVVKRNGKYYAAGEEVPEIEPKDSEIIFESDITAGATAPSQKRGRPAKKAAD